MITLIESSSANNIMSCGLCLLGLRLRSLVSVEHCRVERLLYFVASVVFACHYSCRFALQDFGMSAMLLPHWASVPTAILRQNLPCAWAAFLSFVCAP